MSAFQNVKDNKPFPPLDARRPAEPTASAFDDLKGDELKAKIAELNAERGEDHQIVPASGKKADMIAALVAATSDAAE